MRPIAFAIVSSYSGVLHKVGYAIRYFQHACLVTCIYAPAYITGMFIHMHMLFSLTRLNMSHMDKKV